MIKRLATLLLIACCAVPGMHAIEFKRPPMAVGLTYDYASEYHQHGFGVKLQVPVAKHLRFEPEMIYCNENREVTTLHLNFNAHYLLPIDSHLTVYPMAGISYSHWGYVGPNANRWGLNLGGGIEYPISHRWGILGELRLHAVKQETQVVSTLGIKYNF